MLIKHGFSPGGNDLFTQTERKCHARSSQTIDNGHAFFRMRQVDINEGLNAGCGCAQVGKRAHLCNRHHQNARTVLLRN